MTDASQHKSDRPRLPKHLKKRLKLGGRAREVEQLMRDRALHTVCRSAHCPNCGECFGSGTATFLILGDVCTRDCRFCAIPTEKKPPPLDWDEPERVLAAVKTLELDYVVITSVTRDDLSHGGAEIFAACIRSIREELPEVAVEVLTPDFRGDREALEMVFDAQPSVFNHNVETVPELYPAVRPQADYRQSLEVLRLAAAHEPLLLTKSGVMVGLGETPEQVHRVMDDLVAVGCRLLTIGQYLAPSPRHHPVVEYVEPEQFGRYRDEALKRGFSEVASGPFVRSSYRAHELYRGSETETR